MDQAIHLANDSSSIRLRAPLKPGPLPTDEDAEARAVLALMEARRNTSPRRLAEPAPTDHELQLMLRAAAQAPDHGQLRPWRFLVVPQDKRSLLAEAFAAALLERGDEPTADQLEAARDKAFRGPFLVVAILRRASVSEPEIPDVERTISLGCAIQNLLLAASSMGYSSGLTSGRSLASRSLRDLFRLDEAEQAVCFVCVGTPSNQKPGRVRPNPASFFSSL